MKNQIEEPEELAQELLDWIEEEEEKKREEDLRIASLHLEKNFKEVWGMSEQVFMKKISKPEMKFLVEKIKELG